MRRTHTCVPSVGAQEIGGGAKGPVTGAVGGANAAKANSAIERCDQSLGTLALVEDQHAPWYYELRNRKLGSTVPVIRMMIQQSNCFVVVERGQALHNMKQERALQDSGEMRQGSNFGKGQMVAADYTINPSIQFSQNTGGLRWCARWAVEQARVRWARWPAASRATKPRRR